MVIHFVEIITTESNLRSFYMLNLLFTLNIDLYRKFLIKGVT